MPFRLSKNKLDEFRFLAAEIESDNFPNHYAGWKRICQRSPVYLDSERIMVLKRPNYICNKLTPLKFRVPTIKIDEYGWVLQPYVLKKQTKLAKELLAKQLGDFHCDLHSGNCGWWNGKPVLFDW